MASYAAVVSLLHVLDDIEHPSRRHSIHLDRQQIKSLRERASSFTDILEDISAGLEADELATRMADACYAAEGVIRSHVSARVLPPSVNIVGTSVESCYEEIQARLEEMKFIWEEAAKVRCKEGEVVKNQKAVSRLPTMARSSRKAPTDKNTMVGFDDALVQIMDKLTGHETKFQTIPIVGMGGIGKTTLALHIYNNPCIVEYFVIRAWVAISHEYTVREILLALSECVSKEDVKEKSDDQLREHLHKNLFGRRYLIVMDDVWDIEVWNMIRHFLPDNGKGSRVVMTTRLVGVANEFGSDALHKLNLLEENKSWDLLRNAVFSKDICPVELEEKGKEIARNCGGLPLALTVIGGLLAKCDKKLEYWELVAERLNSTVMSENDDNCLKILHLSYDYLPIHLKPCFLYMSNFREDEEIRISRLIKLWVAEGFLKPIYGKSLEDVAQGYLDDLIDRNLILGHKIGKIGTIKSCVMHDLLRDLSLREAHRENFLRVTRVKSHGEVLDCLQSTSIANLASDAANQYSYEDIMQQVNSRYLSLEDKWEPRPFFWNLQTLIVHNSHLITMPSNFWEMTQLRHFQSDLVILPEPLESHSSTLEYLQTLWCVQDFRCTEEISKRIPNLKKLKVKYSALSDGVEWSYYCLDNLVNLCRLESLTLSVHEKISIEKILFPHSLKELTLRECRFSGDDMTFIGSLPNLEALKLEDNAVEGPEWTVGEGEFARLKFLLIKYTGLSCWRADYDSFPSLEQLFLDRVELKEFPSCFEETPMLRLVKFEFCNGLTSRWARRIKKEREELGYEGIEVVEGLNLYDIFPPRTLEDMIAYCEEFY